MAGHNLNRPDWLLPVLNPPEIVAPLSHTQGADMSVLAQS